MKAFIFLCVGAFISLRTFQAISPWIERELILNEQPIKEGKKITKLAKLRREYKIAVTFRPNNTNEYWGNVLQFVPKGFNVTEYGFYMGTIWYHGIGRQLFIASAVDEQAAFSRIVNATVGELQKVELTQEKVGHEYRFTMSVNGEEIASAVNKYSTVYKDVYVFTGSPWFKTDGGVIKKLSYYTKGYELVGCYREHWTSSIYGKVTKYPYDVVIQQCRDRALAERNEYFAIRENVNCLTSYDAGRTYDKHLKSDACDNGRGAPYVMSVYKAHKEEMLGPCLDKYEWCARNSTQKYCVFNKKEMQNLGVRNRCRKSCNLCN